MRFIIGLLLTLILSNCTSRRSLSDAAIGTRNIELRDSIFLAQHFDTSHIYSKPICLLYEQKPLLRIGEKMSGFPRCFSYRPDPNLEFQDYYGIVTDYLSTSDYFMIEQKSGSINGILVFAADARDHRIFSLSGSWLFDIDTTRAATIQALDALRSKVFPCLPASTKLLKHRSFKINNGDFTESFNLITPKEDSSAFSTYHLQYNVSLDSW